MPQSDQGITLDRYTVIPRNTMFFWRGDLVLLLKGVLAKRLGKQIQLTRQSRGKRGRVLSAAQRELLEEIFIPKTQGFLHPPG